MTVVEDKVTTKHSILDPGMDLTLRPMRYPEFFERYRDAIKNTWVVEEIDWSDDIVDLRTKMSPEEQHLIKRLVAFFATGDSIVSNNLVLNLYKHINSPEARLYLSRQLFEEAQHVQFYLTLLDTYVPDLGERAEAFAAIEHIPSIKAKAEFCFKWMGKISKLEELNTAEERRVFMMNLICFAACVEGMFFFAAFAYVYYLRSLGKLNGLAAGTNWVFRDESGHMDFAFAVVDVIRQEEPWLFTEDFERDVTSMIIEAIECEMAFTDDVIHEGVTGLPKAHIRQYLEFVADQRLVRLGIKPHFGTKNPLDFMMLQDVAEHTNFFERTVSAYQVAVEGDVSFGESF